MAIPRVTVLISGRGSNLAALLAAERDGALAGTIAAVISNRPDAAGSTIAARAWRRDGRRSTHRPTPTATPSTPRWREAIDAAEPGPRRAGGVHAHPRPRVRRALRGPDAQHPSVAAACRIRASHTHRRALADGVRIHGCTVHFVTADLDHGPIVAQGAVPVHDGDDEASLAARVLAVEHRLLPAAVRAFCEGRLVIAGRRVRVKDELVPRHALEVPLGRRLPEPCRAADRNRRRLPTPVSADADPCPPARPPARGRARRPGRRRRASSSRSHLARRAPCVSLWPVEIATAPDAAAAAGDDHRDAAAADAGCRAGGEAAAEAEARDAPRPPRRSRLGAARRSPQPSRRKPATIEPTPERHRDGSGARRPRRSPPRPHAPPAPNRRRRRCRRASISSTRRSSARRAS